MPVTAEIPSGCMVGLIGPDGVGKSTLMGIIAGAKKIQAGKVQVLGGDIADRRHRNAVCPRIAYMPQGPGQEPLFRAERLREHRLLRTTVRALRRGAPHADRRAPEGHRARPFPGPAGREAFGRHEAEGRALLVADSRPRPAHPRRADDRRRPALAAAVLDARRPHPRRAAGDERPRLDRVHGRSRALRLADRDGCRPDPGHGHPRRAQATDGNREPGRDLRGPVARGETRLGRAG